MAIGYWIEEGTPIIVYNHDNPTEVLETRTSKKLGFLEHSVAMYTPTTTTFIRENDEGTWCMRVANGYISYR